VIPRRSAVVDRGDGPTGMWSEVSMLLTVRDVSTMLRVPESTVYR
jgi:hypothetical protein